MFLIFPNGYFRKFWLFVCLLHLINLFFSNEVTSLVETFQWLCLAHSCNLSSLHSSASLVPPTSPVLSSSGLTFYWSATLKHFISFRCVLCNFFLMALLEITSTVFSSCHLLNQLTPNVPLICKTASYRQLAWRSGYCTLPSEMGHAKA